MNSQKLSVDVKEYMMRKFDEIDNIIDSSKFSGVVKISSEENLLYERAVGYADRPNEVPIDIYTRFGIASGTKFLTALAIGRLIDRGDLSLESKALEIIDYNFETYDRDITIEHLLTHTSGIPDYYDEDVNDDFDNFTVAIPWYELYEPEQYFEIFPKVAMEYKPGSTFKYNNSGYVLLAAIVATISGKRYSEFVKEEIFDVACMNSSGFYQLNKLPKNTANGYIEEENSYRTNIYNLPILGAGDGGAFSTANDMIKLWEAFLGYKILSEELTNAYIKPQVQVSKKKNCSWYGYGLWLQVKKERVADIAIEGCDAGVSFKSGYQIETGISYAVLSNTTNGAWPLTKAIRDNIL